MGKTQPKKALNNNEVAFTPTYNVFAFRIAGRGVIRIVCNVRVDINQLSF